MRDRDDHASLESRREDLKQRLAEATAHTDALRSAVETRDAVERTLAEVEARLDQRGKRRRSVLDDLRVASPCNASWEAMKGDDRVRFCGECEKNVYNLSSMTRDEAERLFAEHDEPPCVRFYQREDGTVITTDCPVGARRKRRLRIAYGLAGASTMAITAAAFTVPTTTQGKPVAATGVVAPGEQPTTTPVETTAAPQETTARPPIRATMGAVSLPLPSALPTTGKPKGPLPRKTNR